MWCCAFKLAVISLQVRDQLPGLHERHFQDGAERDSAGRTGGRAAERGGGEFFVHAAHVDYRPT